MGKSLPSAVLRLVQAFSACIKLLLPNASSLSSPPQTLPTKKYLALQIQSQRLLLEHVTSDLLLQPEIAS